MKFSEKWLREWVDPAVDTDGLAEQLTLLGLEVDDLERGAALGEKVIVAEILSTAQHPDADRLRVCQVDTGAGEVQIVCGAPNARAGLRAPLALPGARLPGGIKIKKSTLRGVASEGMLCSARELELSEEDAGLHEFANDAPVGATVVDYLGLDDVTFDIDLTPNRGDCLSIRGVAFDLSARNDIAVNAVDIPNIAATQDQSLPVSIAPDTGCVRFAGRVIRGVRADAPSPAWLVEKLRRSGVRSISPIVDLTNYVMFELGQPMHAYDLATVATGITVRGADGAESVTLLDEREVTPEAGTVLITDSAGPIGLGGIMGGLSTGVSEGTTDVFLEAALFHHLAIAGKPRTLNAHTDAAARFERGVERGLQEQAIERMTALVLDICGGEPGPIDVVENPDYPAETVSIRLRRARIPAVLGCPFDDAEVTSILGRLGVALQPTDDGWNAVPPARRYDLRIEEDLIEELARIRGFDSIPRTSPNTHLTMQAVSETATPSAALRSALVQRGYLEAVTYSFVDPELQSQLVPDVDAIPLANPISSDLAVMRTSLLPGLVQALQRNQHRQQPRVRLFEFGRRYLRDATGAVVETPLVAGVACGGVVAETWRDNTEVDFFSVKADLEALVALSGAAVRCVAGEHAALHPGRCAEVLIDRKPAGWLGELHPRHIESLGLSARPVVFEVALDALSGGALPAFAGLSKFPVVRRDLALVLDAAIPVQGLLDVVRQHAGATLSDLVVFDVYTGVGVTDGCKSVALGLILQDFSRTLSEQDVDDVVSRVLENVATELGAKLR
ncbi:MAG: phenylalanine--tRNA ligase subunit beta [Pseudomonadota bacterium]